MRSVLSQRCGKVYRRRGLTDAAFLIGHGDQACPFRLGKGGMGQSVISGAFVGHLTTQRRTLPIKNTTEGFGRRFHHCVMMIVCCHRSSLFNVRSSVPIRMDMICVIHIPYPLLWISVDKWITTTVTSTIHHRKSEVFQRFSPIPTIGDRVVDNSIDEVQMWITSTSVPSSTFVNNYHMCRFQTWTDLCFHHSGTTATIA